MSSSRSGFMLGAIAFTLAVAGCGGSDAPEGGPSAGSTPAASTPAAAGMDLTGVTLPAGVTPAMASAGAALFPTQVCTACHGVSAGGMEGLGPNLTDATWLNSDGSFEAIVQTITTGVAAPHSFPGMMPPKGGNPAITDAQVRELAAYIYALSHRM